VSSQPVPVSNPCWCCGQECMFCDPGETVTELDHMLSHCERLHWCSECKFSGCEYCCGCDECRILKRAGWSPRELPLDERAPHTRKE
jgi:hypothetical protein